MLTEISSLLWIVTTIIIIIISIFFSLYLKFPQFSLSNKVKKSDKNNVKETFKLLNLTLAGKIGVGSISGIAISIIVGGKGTLFWIWISSLFLSIFTYLETKTGIKYRENINGQKIGGPQVYIERVLKNRKLSKIYSILIIFTFLYAFILIQANTIVSSFESIFSFNKLTLTLILLIFVLLSIRKGLKGITKVVSFLVPIMGLIYILIGLYVIKVNYQLTFSILKDIFKEAFNIKSLATIPFIIGFQRSIFSNEAGMGSTSFVVATSNSNDYIKEAKIQLFGMYFITLVICTISAFIILTTNYEAYNFQNINGIEIINYAFFYHFGEFGMYLSNLVVTLFAFSTIITSYFYGEQALKYLFKNKTNTLAKIIVIIVIVLSANVSTGNIWAFVDIATSLTTIINIYALFKMRKELKKI